MNLAIQLQLKEFVAISRVEEEEKKPTFGGFNLLYYPHALPQLHFWMVFPPDSSFHVTSNILIEFPASY